MAEEAVSPDAPVEVKPEDPPRKIAVLGEIPFSGRALTRNLLSQGYSVQVLCPDSAVEAALADLRANDTKMATLETVRGSLESAETVNAMLKNVYGAVFLSPITMAGRIYRPESHLEDVRRVTESAEKNAIRKLVYHSALGAHPKSSSRALREAAEAEERMHASRFQDFRVRTGPLMGSGDGFLSEIINTMRGASPIMSILGYGSTVVQPLHVDDMARCMTRIFNDSEEELAPGIYNLAGPEITTILDLVDLAGARLNRVKLRFHAPLFALQLAASSVKAGDAGFKERIGLLFDTFFTEQNDALKLIGMTQKLTTAQQAQDEILNAA